MKQNIRNEYGIRMAGKALDGENLQIITRGMMQDLQTILCYDYEDGKPWHDLTCVMELIFHKPNQLLEERDSRRIRYLYENPYFLLRDFSALTEDPGLTSTMLSVRMDLTVGWYQHENKDRDICTEDFETFNCTIKHKTHFHPDNPEMPDD